MLRRALPISRAQVQLEPALHQRSAARRARRGAGRTGPRAGRLLADREDAGDACRACRRWQSPCPVLVAGSSSPAKRGRYCSSIASQTSAASPSCCGVIATHQALQFRELADHGGQQVALGDFGGAHRRARRLPPIPARDLARPARATRARPCRRASRAGPGRSRARARRGASRGGCLAIRAQKKAASREPRAHHALVAGAHLRAGRELSMFATVMNHGISRAVRVRVPGSSAGGPAWSRSALRRQLEKALVEASRKRHRPFDQRRHFVEQVVLDDRLAARVWPRRR